LDILSRLKQACAVRKALAQLPETLDKTYERIFCGIPKESVMFVYRALALLCADFATIIPTVEILVDAVLYLQNSIGERLSEDIFDVDALEEACTCLITVSNTATSEVSGGLGFFGRRVRLAYYIVREFLTLSRITESPASRYRLTPAKAS
jgi:hypothetical protein